MFSNMYLLFITALIPMAVGMVYYHPKVVGTAWMKSNGFTTEDIQGGNMPLILGLSYLFALILSFLLSGMVIHQAAIISLMFPDSIDNTAAWQAVQEAMAPYMDRHRSFTHGLTHGIFYGVLFAGAVIGTNSLFERRGWKYILIHVGYWAITMGLMGGVLCQFLEFA